MNYFHWFSQSETYKSSVTISSSQSETRWGQNFDKFKIKTILLKNAEIGD